MHKLTYVDPMSWAKVQAVMTMLLMILMWALRAIFFFPAASFGGRLGMMGGYYGNMMNFGGGLYAGRLLIMIPVAGIVSFAVGYVGAWLLNVVLKWLGGIKFEMKA